MTTERDDWKPYNSGDDDGKGREKRPYNQSERGSYENNDRSYNRQDGGNRRPYGNNDNRGGYGGGRPQGGGNYGYSNNRGNYDNRDNNSGYGNRPQRGGYDNSRGGYDNSRGGYDNSRGGYDNSRGGYNNSRGGYDNSRSGYDNNRSYGNSPRQYDRKPYDGNNSGGYNSGNNYGNVQRNNDDGGLVKKRRPRVGETSAPSRGGNSYNNDRDRGNSFGGGRQQGGYNNRDNRGGGNNYNRPQGRPGGQGGGFQQRRPGGYDHNPHAKYSVQKQLKYREENFDPNEPLRLNKYLANAGVCSRREADEFIQAGAVKVNGEVVTELGTKVKRADQVMFHDQPIKLEHKIYVLLNKPKNCVTTADDPQERLTVMDLVKNACRERIFPVGRLDRNTTGVLLLTNDGDLASKLTHPKFLKKKIYHVWLDKSVAIADMQKMAEGVELEDGEIHADAISYVTDTDKDQVGIEIHSGRNRIVRRMFESLGYHVTRLDRVYFAGLTKKNLKRGQWRYLSDKEVAMLRMGAFE